MTPSCILLEGLDGLAGVVVPVGERRAQQAIEAVPGQHDLRQRVLAERAAVAVEDDAADHLGTDLVAAGDAGRAQRVEQLGMGDDAGAAAGERLARALEDVDREAQARAAGRPRTGRRSSRPR